MADDSPFIPPLGKVDFPASVQELEPPELVRQILQLLAGPGPHRLHLNPGCGRPGAQPDGPWYPLVIVLLDETTWYMRPATARAIGMLAAGERRFELHFGDASAVGRHFAEAADQADALAAGKTPFKQSKELN